MTLLATPTSASIASVMLVSTVTPITSGRGRPSAAADLRAASAAAVIITVPPDACTFTIHAPVATARQFAHHRGTGGREQLLADLVAADRSAQLPGEIDRLGRGLDIQGNENRVHA